MKIAVRRKFDVMWFWPPGAEVAEKTGSNFGGCTVKAVGLAKKTVSLFTVIVGTVPQNDACQAFFTPAGWSPRGRVVRACQRRLIGGYRVRLAGSGHGTVAPRPVPAVPAVSVHSPGLLWAVAGARNRSACPGYGCAGWPVGGVRVARSCAKCRLMVL